MADPVELSHAVKIGEDEDDDDAEEAALMLNFRLVEFNESYLAS